jgi:hypothetical protein
MRKLGGTVLAVGLAIGLSGAGRAADPKEVNAVLDKAIKALGGEEKLAKAKAMSTATKGTIVLMGQETEVTTRMTVEGLDHARQEFEGEFGGNKLTVVTVLASDKGWRKFGDNTMELNKEALANQKRGTYMLVAAVTELPLKGKNFKVELAGEEKVGGKAAVGVKATGPDGKDFKIYFDKESGLPVKSVAKVAGLMGGEFDQETTFADFKDMDGIKKATTVKATRDGEKFSEQKVTEFKVLDKVDAKTFAEP